MENKIIFSARNVEIDFNLRGKHLKAIRKASLDLFEGETFAIVGESGSGKTVFTKSFIGMTDKNGRVTGGAVSYTHLDVYKRQVRGLMANCIDGLIEPDQYGVYKPSLAESWDCLLYTSRCV